MLKERLKFFGLVFIVGFACLNAFAFGLNIETKKDDIQYNTTLNCTVQDKTRFDSLTGKTHSNYNVEWMVICKNEVGYMYQRDVSYLTWFQADIGKIIHFEPKRETPSIGMYWFILFLSLAIAGLFTLIREFD